jgi:phage I-like protein
MPIQLTRIAIAPCTFDVPVPIAAGDSNLVMVQVTPAGYFGTTDGRDLPPNGYWIDAAIATGVIARFNTRRTPLVVDYEHQTLNAAQNGQPAPAAGWFRSLEWRDGSGLWAQIEITPRANGLITAREYKYFSPVFSYDGVSGAVIELFMGAFTNNPGIDGMAAVELIAAASRRYYNHPPENSSMDKTLLALIAALGLAEGATQEQALAALTARLDTHAVLRKAFALDDKADDQALIAACTALTARQADPTKFVPVAAVQELQGQIAALSARLTARDEADVGAQIDAALADGRLLKPLEAWARDLGKTNSAALTAFLAGAAPIAALVRSQTGGNPPAVDETTGLTADELAVCTAMGLDPKSYAAARETA